MPNSSLDISEFLAHLRSELEAAETDRKELGKDALFSIQEIELEISFTVTKGGSGKGGLNLQVVSAELGGKLDHAIVQRARIKLTIDEAAKNARVPGSRPYPPGRTKPV